MITWKREVFKAIERRFPNEVREEHLYSELNRLFSADYTKDRIDAALNELMSKNIIGRQIKSYEYRSSTMEIRSYYLIQEAYRNINPIRIGDYDYCRLLDADRFRVDDINFLIEELSIYAKSLEEKNRQIEEKIQDWKKELRRELSSDILKAFGKWVTFIVALLSLFIAVICNWTKISDIVKDWF